MEHALDVEIEIAVPPARVFAAWTKPELVKAWWQVPGEFRTVAFDSDLRVGGKWQARFETEDGTKFGTGGAYVGLAEPSLLNFTWKAMWEDCAPSIARMDFTANAAGTTLKLHHTRFQSAQEAVANREAWVSALGLLKAYLEASA
ncbi:MAG TPA: SRPBCC domain-containing protein [Rhizomicrobium sp.]